MKTLPLKREGDGATPSESVTEGRFLSIEAAPSFEVLSGEERGDFKEDLFSGMLLQGVTLRAFGL